MQAGGFLATNLLLHATTVMLVFALARRRLGHAGALIAALVFAVQPANAEVVAYVSGQSTGLMTPLLLGGLLLYDQGRQLGALAYSLSRAWRRNTADIPCTGTRMGTHADRAATRSPAMSSRQ